MRVVDTQEYLDNVCQLLRQGHTSVPVPVSGDSMRPFLHPGDMVYLDLPQPPLRKGDVVLFTRPTGQYILHRICQVYPDGSFRMRGDNQDWTEIVPSADFIHARVTLVRRKQELLLQGTLRWWFFEKVWLNTALVREWLRRPWDMIRKP